MNKVQDSFSTYRAQHPKYLIALFLGGVLLFILTGSPSRLKEVYGYPPLRATHTNLSDAEQNVTQIEYPPFGPVDLGAAVDRAEELWERNVGKRTHFINEHGGLSNMRMFSSTGLLQKFTLWDVFVPSFPCPWEVERIGRMGDGGKLTCGLPRVQAARGSKCVVYSFGVERESSWEAEILERTECEIFMYDFSVDTYGPQLQAMNASMQARAHFHKYGISERDEVVGGHQFYTLRTLMRMNGHDWIDIFKIDVEGAEFKVMPDMILDFGRNQLPFDQMLMEVHAEFTSPAYSTREFANWWEHLEKAGLRAFSSELNYPAIHWNPFPMAIEMNFVNYGARKISKGKLLSD